ncbi:MAG: tetratricopeptide repeat protein [Polyangiaceae bacterium]
MAARCIGATRSRHRFGGAALAVLMLLASASGAAFAGDAPAAEPTDAARKEATDLYSKGRELYVAKHYDEALAALSRSLELLPSPNTALLIAHAHHDAGHLRLAMTYYERARSMAAREIQNGQARYKPTEAEAGRAIESLARELTALKITAPSGSKISIKGSDGVVFEVDAAPESAPLVVWVLPGQTVVTASVGENSTSKTVTTSGGATTAIELSLAPDARQPDDQATSEGLPPLVFAGIGVGALGLVGFGLFAGFGVAAGATFDDLEALPDRAACDSACLAQAHDLADQGKQQQLIANVSVGLGAAFLAAGVLMIALPIALDGHESASNRTSARIIVAPTSGGGFVGVSLDVR